MIPLANFYPSITRKLLLDALSYARLYVKILQTDGDIMLQAKNSLHFDCGEAWMKKENNTAFEVKMGSFAVAKVCELVGEYILSKLRLLLQERSVGLCSYDGFTILRPRLRA